MSIAFREEILENISKSPFTGTKLDESPLMLTFNSLSLKWLIHRCSNPRLLLLLLSSFDSFLIDIITQIQAEPPKLKHLGQ